MQIGEHITCRLCGADTEIVVLHCPALATKVWPVLLSVLTGLTGLGLNRDDTVQGTLLLNFKPPNDSNEVATGLAFLLARLSKDPPANSNHR